MRGRIVGHSGKYSEMALILLGCRKVLSPRLSSRKGRSIMAKSVMHRKTASVIIPHQESPTTNKAESSKANTKTTKRQTKAPKSSPQATSTSANTSKTRNTEKAFLFGSIKKERKINMQNKNNIILGRGGLGILRELGNILGVMVICILVSIGMA